MGPDPEKLKNDHSFDRPDYVINQLDDEMDVEENLPNDGYVILNQNSDEQQQYMVINDDDSESDEEYNFQEQPQMDMPQDPPNVPIISSASSELIANVWNSTSSSNNIEITNEKSEQITQIMSKINLPNAPNWLNEINTENILDRIRNKHRETDSTVNN